MVRFTRGDDDPPVERDEWTEGQIIGQAEYDDLCADLGGEPTGDWILLPCPDREGNGDTPAWWVVGPDTRNLIGSLLAWRASGR